MIAENISHDSIVGYHEYRLKPGAKGDKKEDFELIKDTMNYKYDNLPGYHYIDIEYDLQIEDETAKAVLEADGKKRKPKKKLGYKMCRFAEADNMDKSVLPRILRKLLKARKDTRKKIEYVSHTMKDGSVEIGIPKELNDGRIELFHVENGTSHILKEDVVSEDDTYSDFEKSVLEGLQLAYKVTCNSLYGQVGATTSPICFKELAACTTATGRRMVCTARDLTLQTFVGCKLVYGDSVTGDTPLLLKRNDEIFVKNIKDLNDEWIAYEEFKPYDTNRIEKQQTYFDAEIWTSNGWANINRVIRHKTQKKIYRILTHTGCVDVTEDHSLLDEDLNKIKPTEVSIGTKLRHDFPTEFYERDYGITYEEAFLWGFFMGDGSCGAYKTKSSGMKYSWALNNQDVSLLEKLMGYAQKIEGLNFKMLDTFESSHVYKVVPTVNLKNIVLKYRQLFYDNNGSKIVPVQILNSPIEIKNGFLEGLYAADGCRKDTSTIGCHRIDTKNKISAQSIYLLLRSMGYNVSINTRKDKLNIFRLNYTKNSFRKSFNSIKKIDLLHEVDFDEYVYDIETTDGTFQAGIGQMIVKNTDSVFINFTDHIKSKYPDRELTEKELLAESIQMGILAARNINSHMKSPQNIEYEKTLWPFCIFSKKRYFGNLYEHNPEKYKPKYMGIVLKRRDNAPIVKTIYGGVLDIILNKRDLEASKRYFRTSIQDMLDGKVDISQLVISKTLKSDYKNPSAIAHKVLADRMAERDPGNKPQSNDRIPYCYIDSVNLKCKVCSRAVNVTKCKCITCMNMFCATHLVRHKESCIKNCRFCHVKENEQPLQKCNTCLAYYCGRCFTKHQEREDRKTEKDRVIIRMDKCKKPLTNKILQGDILEHPEYIKEANLKIDYKYYFDHQIWEPVKQIFDLVMPDSQVIVADILRKFENSKKGNHEITDWFKKIPGGSSFVKPPEPPVAVVEVLESANVEEVVEAIEAIEEMPTTESASNCNMISEKKRKPIPIVSSKYDVKKSIQEIKNNVINDELFVEIDDEDIEGEGEGEEDGEIVVGGDVDMEEECGVSDNIDFDYGE